MACGLGQAAALTPAPPGHRNRRRHHRCSASAAWQEPVGMASSAKHTNHCICPAAPLAPTRCALVSPKGQQDAEQAIAQLCNRCPGQPSIILCCVPGDGTWLAPGRCAPGAAGGNVGGILGLSVWLLAHAWEACCMVRIPSPGPQSLMPVKIVGQICRCHATKLLLYA